MKKTAKSLGHSLEGLRHAWNNETNLRRFILAQALLIILAVALGGDIGSIIMLLIFGGMFVVVELLNTAIERLADTFDDDEKKKHGGHWHPGIKMTKDVAAAAALIALIIDACVVVLIYIPLIVFTMQRYGV